MAAISSLGRLLPLRHGSFRQGSVLINFRHARIYLGTYPWEIPELLAYPKWSCWGGGAVYRDSWQTVARTLVCREVVHRYRRVGCARHISLYWKSRNIFN